VLITLPYTPDPDELTVALAYYDEAAGTWAPVSATVDPAAGTLTAQVDHLSWWKEWTWALPDVKGWVQDQFHQAVNAPGGDQPTCGGEAELREDVAVSSDDGDRVRWCTGLENGQQVLRATNTRSYSVEMTIPDGWQKVSVTPTLGVLDSAISASANAITFDPRRPIIGPSQTLTLTSPAGTSGKVSVIPNGGAYVFSALALAIETVAMVTAKVPGAASADEGKLAAVARAVWDDATCADSLRELVVDGAPDSADSLGQHFQDALGTSVGCLKGVWQKAYGVDGAIFAVVVGVITRMVGAVRTLISGVKALVESLRDLNGYNIVLAARQAAAAPGAGDVGATSTDVADLAGGTWGAYFSSAEHPDWGSFQVQMSRDGETAAVNTGDCEYTWQLTTTDELYARYAATITAGAPGQCLEVVEMLVARLADGRLRVSSADWVSGVYLDPYDTLPTRYHDPQPDTSTIVGRWTGAVTRPEGGSEQYPVTVEIHESGGTLVAEITYADPGSGTTTWTESVRYYAAVSGDNGFRAYTFTLSSSGALTVDTGPTWDEAGGWGVLRRAG
jgi:hypothetical protein